MIEIPRKLLLQKKLGVKRSLGCILPHDISLDKATPRRTKDDFYYTDAVKAGYLTLVPPKPQ